MRLQRRPEIWLLQVSQALLFAGLFKYFVDGRVMNMADSWEKMMFYLKIKAT